MAQNASDPNDAVTLQIKGNVGIITLNVPKKLNAMTQALFHKVAVYLRECAKNDAVLFTVLTGKGRFFSAGADVRGGANRLNQPQTRQHLLGSFVVNNFEVTQAFYSHPKILISALNGPVVGLAAALIAYSDFIYAAPHTYLLTPFSSLGLVAEGGASKAFVERLGISKANEALLMSKKIGVEELVQVGFVNKVFDVQPGEDRFLDLVLKEVDDRLGAHLVPNSLLQIKKLIRKADMEKQDSQLVAELLGGLEVFEKGIPQQEFNKVATGQKRHKL